MRVRFAITATVALTIAQPLTGRLARGDTQLDNAVQTALDIGQVIGAASACPEIAQGRVRALTERFKASLKQFGGTNDENTAIGSAFDQGIVFGSQSNGAARLRCESASRNLADWAANQAPMMPSRTGVPAAPVATGATPPPVVQAPVVPSPASSTPLAPSFTAPVVAAPVVVPPVAAPPPPVIAAPAAPSNLPAVQGVTDKEIRFGMVAPLSGPAQDLGRQMRLGIETAFGAVNDAGGINGRKLVLVAADDGYDPARTGDAMRQLYEKDRVFGFIGNVGTPTTAVALPYAMTHRALFFGAFTGAPLLRADPPDRYVFNYRASYAEETFAVVHYLVKVRHLKPEQIAVFAQQDGYGDAGFEGVAAAMRALNPAGDGGIVPRFGYQRNTDEVDGAISQIQQYQRLHTTVPIRAIVMVATAKAAAKFIGYTHDRIPGLVYTNVSFVGSTALAKDLLAFGPKIVDGTIVTQVVPPVDSYSSVALNYKAALAKYAPNAAPDYVSFEGYLDANVLIEGLRRVGSQVDTERLVNSLETIKDFDLGVGVKIDFSSGSHQALHKIWGTQLDDKGTYKAINLE